MDISFDSEQLRVINWRASTKDVSGVIGPPGCGKTTVGSALAVKLVAERLAKRVLLVAYTNAAANEFCWELCNILGIEVANRICLRTGNEKGVDALVPIRFSKNANDILEKRIVISTNLSLKRLPPLMRFDNMIIDEAGIERLEHLLWPLWFGVDNSAAQRYKYSHTTNHGATNESDHNDDDTHYQINDLIELISKCGTVATVVGDPKQSRPISPDRIDYSAIEWVMKRSRCDILRISHRLPDRLSGLVNEFAKYDGLRSSQEIALRRLTLERSPDVEYKDIIQPDEVTTWVDIDGSEQPIGPSSWANDMEAKACAKICDHLVHIAPRKSVVVVSRFRAQKQIIGGYLQRMGHHDVVKVTTTTGALGTQADIVLFSLTRNNPERNVGAAGTLQDINVAILLVYSHKNKMAWIQNRKEKKEYVIRLRKENKNVRQIAKIVHMSFRDISAIINEYEAEAEGHTTDQIDTKPKSKESQAFKMFLEGKTPIEVVIALDLEAGVVGAMYLDYWELCGMPEVVTIYKKIRGELIPFLEFYNSAKSQGMGKNEMMNGLKICNTNELPYLQEKVEYYREQLNILNLKIANATNDKLVLNRSIDELTEVKNMCISSLNEKREELAWFNQELRRLDHLVKNSHDKKGDENVEVFYVNGSWEYHRN